jgi:hypothetical protein
MANVKGGEVGGQVSQIPVLPGSCRSLEVAPQGTQRGDHRRFRPGWKRNLYRLQHLSDEHRSMLERIQPYNAQRQELNCLSILNRLARKDRHRALHAAGAYSSKGQIAVWSAGSFVYGKVLHPQAIIEDETIICSFTFRPWNPAQKIEAYTDITLEVEIAEMVSERPWGPLDKRLTVIHRAVSEYIAGLAAYALEDRSP